MANRQDYTELTELPGSGATGEQLERLYHRYHTANRYAADKTVLEVASGAGFGLGYLDRSAAKVVGGDYTANLLNIARSHYGERIPQLRLDGQYLPFGPSSFDLVLIFEALYYLPDAGRFIAETHRVLTEKGTIIICTVNRDWDEFSPSPSSTHYLNVPELRDALESAGFTRFEFFGAFPTEAKSLKSRITGLIRKVIVGLDLMPKTLEGRERFKRMFYGELTPMPAEITEGLAELSQLVPIADNEPNKGYKIIYAIGHRALSILAYGTKENPW